MFTAKKIKVYHVSIFLEHFTFKKWDKKAFKKQGNNNFQILLPPMISGKKYILMFYSF